MAGSCLCRERRDRHQGRIAHFENGPSRSTFNVVNVNAHSKGGHFGHCENPDAFVGDVRETFRRAR